MPAIGAVALAQRRQRILDAAGALVDRHGPAALTTRALVAEARISTGALYHHFTGIEAVVEALAEQRLVVGIGAVAARAPAGEDPLAWLVRALVCAPTEGVVGGRGAGVDRVIRATVDEVMRAAGAAGSLRSDLDVEALAELLELLWVAVDERAGDGRVRTSPTRLAAALGSALDAGVRPRPLK